MPLPPAPGAPQIESLGSPLIQAGDLVYLGAFRCPSGSGTNSLNYGGTGLCYWPAHNSLLIVGHDWEQKVCEISIPAPSLAGTVSALPRAVYLQPLTDILQGKRLTVDGGKGNGVKLGGITVVGSALAVNAWTYYDGSPTPQTLTHFVTGQNFATLTPSSVSGPFRVGNGFQYLKPSDVMRIGGFVSGYMCPIPSAYQSVLGGTHLTGQGGMVSILNRTSSGPSASAYTPTDLGVTLPAPVGGNRPLMGYPSNSSNTNDVLHHPTLGVWGQNTQPPSLYNGTQGFRGMVFPDGTRSILFIGWGGQRFCYGPGTTNLALDLQPVPNSTQHYCYDPTKASTGTHGYLPPSTPESSLIFAYDADEFTLTKQGVKQPWEVVPYATWNLSLPFQGGAKDLLGAAYDPATRRLFVSAAFSDGNMPLIHVYQLP